MKTIKELLPTTKIFFQSLLPIPSNGCPHTERNVLLMNNMLFNLCSKYKLFFIDAFNAFLDNYGHRNLYFFPAYDAVKEYFDITNNE